MWRPRESTKSRDVSDVSRLVCKKLELYMNQERREMKFDPTGRGYGTTKHMWKYDVLYRVLEKTILDKKSPRKSEKKDKSNATGENPDTDRAFRPELEANSRRVVSHTEADRLASYAKETLDQQPLDQLQVLHRYRPKHLKNIGDIPENGKVHNYTKHVGSCLRSQSYVNYYVSEGLHTGKKDGANRLQKLSSGENRKPKSAKTNNSTEKRSKSEELTPVQQKSALRGKGKKTAPKTVRFKRTSTEDLYKAEKTPLVCLQKKCHYVSRSSLDQEDGGLIDDDSYDDDVFEDDDEPGKPEDEPENSDNPDELRRESESRSSKSSKAMSVLDGSELHQRSRPTEAVSDEISQEKESGGLDDDEIKTDQNNRNGNGRSEGSNWQDDRHYTIQKSETSLSMEMDANTSGDVEIEVEDKTASNRNGSNSMTSYRSVSVHEGSSSSDSDTRSTVTASTKSSTSESSTDNVKNSIWTYASVEHVTGR